MTERSAIYKCSQCGDMLEVLHEGTGGFVCCDHPMQLLTENTTDASTEKHVPVITRVPRGVKVVVGSVAHPMEAKHYIEWIELLAGEQVLRQFLHPGQAPEAFFATEAQHLTAREICNLHGLWRSEE
jgi:superoxide reductase